MFDATYYASLASSAYGDCKMYGLKKKRGNDTLYGKGRDKTVFGGLSWIDGVDMTIKIILLASLRRGAGEGCSVRSGFQT
jgi:hypothetical protein